MTAVCVTTLLFVAVAPSIASADHCPTGWEGTGTDPGHCTLKDIPKDEGLDSDDFFKRGPGKALLNVLKGLSVALILIGGWHASKSFRGGGGAAKGVQVFLLYLLLALFLFDLDFTLRIMQGLGGLLEALVEWFFSLF